MKNVLKTAALCVFASSAVFAAPNDYEKKGKDPYGDGTLKKVAQEIPEFFADINEELVLDHKVEIQVRDIDGQDTVKVIRYTVDGFLGDNDQDSYYNDRSNRDNDRSGMFPFTIKLEAEDGSDVSIEEARLAFIQLQSMVDGITAQIIELASDNGHTFMTDAVQDMKTADILNIRLSDAVHTFENGNMIVFNGFARAGWVKDLESYGTKGSSSISATTRIEYGSAIGVKFRNLLGSVDVTPEVFNRTINFNKASDFEVSRTGFQVNFETSFTERLGCSANIGIAEEEVEGQFNEDNKEVYIGTQCEF